jgi:hypothetical protein
MAVIGGDELRQERQEEDRQLGIEDVDEDAGDDDAPARGSGACGSLNARGGLEVREG